MGAPGMAHFTAHFLRVAVWLDVAETPFNGSTLKGKKKHKAELDSNKQRSGVDGGPKVGKKEYEKEIFKQQVELVRLQDWVKATNARLVIIFEGRDAAGKGGMIKRIMRECQPAHLSRGGPPRTDREAEGAAPCSALR